MNHVVALFECVLNEVLDLTIADGISATFIECTSFVDTDAAGENPAHDVRSKANRDTDFSSCFIIVINATKQQKTMSKNESFLPEASSYAINQRA